MIDWFLPISIYGFGCHPKQCAHRACDNYINRSPTVTNPRCTSDPLLIVSWKVYLYMRSISISGSSWNSLIFTVSYRMLFRLQSSSSTCKRWVYKAQIIFTLYVVQGNESGLHWKCKGQPGAGFSKSQDCKWKAASTGSSGAFVFAGTGAPEAHMCTGP